VFQFMLIVTSLYGLNSKPLTEPEPDPEPVPEPDPDPDPDPEPDPDPDPDPDPELPVQAPSDVHGSPEPLPPLLLAGSLPSVQ
jgi:hypothetical protein